MTERRHNRSEAERFLRLLMDPEGVHEVKVLNAHRDPRTNYYVPATTRKSYVGWYDNPYRLSSLVMQTEGVNVYVSINPIPKAFAGGALNGVRVAKDDVKAAKKEDYLRWNWLMVDVDAGQVSGQSATDAEREAALTLRDRIVQTEDKLLNQAMWGSSGNGGWVLVKLGGFGNDGNAEADARSVLGHLAGKYGAQGHARPFVDHAACSITQSLTIPGSLKCKGTETVQTPWRLATFDGHRLDQGS